MTRTNPDPLTAQAYVQQQVALVRTPRGELVFWYKHRNLARLMTECLMGVCVELPVPFRESPPGSKAALRNERGREAFALLREQLGQMSDEEAMTRFPSFGHILVTLRLGLSIMWPAIPPPKGAKIIRVQEVIPVFQAQVKDQAYKRILESNELADVELLLSPVKPAPAPAAPPPPPPAPAVVTPAAPRKRGRPPGTRNKRTA